METNHCILYSVFFEACIAYLFGRKGYFAKAIHNSFHNINVNSISYFILRIVMTPCISIAFVSGDQFQKDQNLTETQRVMLTIP